MHTHTHTHARTHAHTHTHARTHTHSHTHHLLAQREDLSEDGCEGSISIRFARPYLCVCVCVCVCVYYIYIHTHTCIYIRVPTRNSPRTLCKFSLEKYTKLTRTHTA